MYTYLMDLELSFGKAHTLFLLRSLFLCATMGDSSVLVHTVHNI
jgi:hypothetical protein